MSFRGKYKIRSKIILNSKIMEQFQNFNDLGCDLSFNYDDYLRQRYTNFNVCRTIKIILRNKIVEVCKVMAVRMVGDVWMGMLGHE
jgi:hypothetical protein